MRLDEQQEKEFLVSRITRLLQGCDIRFLRAALEELQRLVVQKRCTPRGEQARKGPG